MMQTRHQAGTGQAGLLSEPREPTHAGRRIGYILGGSALLLAGMRKLPIGLLPAALGLGAIYRGVAPARLVRRTLDIQRVVDPHTPHDFTAVRSITINRPLNDLVAFWRNTRNIPRFLSGITDVEELDENTWRWQSGQGDQAVQWTTEMSFGQNNSEHTIQWRSSPAAPFAHEGLARFRPAPGHRGTELSVRLRYSIPGGAAGALLALIGDHEPSVRLGGDLHKLKQLLETGQITTIECQSSARADAAPSENAEPQRKHKDQVQEGSEESFPASDPPAWMAGNAKPEADASMEATA